MSSQRRDMTYDEALLFVESKAKKKANKAQADRKKKRDAELLSRGRR